MLGFFGASEWCGGEGVVGPGVSGVSSLEFASDLVVGVCPEVGEVLCELYGFEAWGEDFEEDGLEAVVDCGSACESEYFL